MYIIECDKSVYSATVVYIYISRNEGLKETVGEYNKTIDGMAYRGWRIQSHKDQSRRRLRVAVGCATCRARKLSFTHTPHHVSGFCRLDAAPPPSQTQDAMTPYLYHVCNTVSTEACLLLG